MLITKILGWFVGKPLEGVLSNLKDAYKLRLQAKNSKQRIEADQNIAVTHAQTAVLLTEAVNRQSLTRWIRPAFAAPIIIYNFKVIVWDACLGLGTTPQLPANLMEITNGIIGAYFLMRAREKYI